MRQTPFLVVFVLSWENEKKKLFKRLLFEFRRKKLIRKSVAKVVEKTKLCVSFKHRDKKGAKGSARSAGALGVGIFLKRGEIKQSVSLSVCQSTSKCRNTKNRKKRSTRFATDHHKAT